METDIKNDSSDRQTQAEEEEEEEKKIPQGIMKIALAHHSAALCVKCFSTNAKLGPVCMVHRA